jgi:bifunctional oligoribonuclease and PAP phosphatase NrnA
LSTLKQAITSLGQMIDEAKTILILQPEKPDTDSLTASLALEQILGERGKEIILYCQDEVPRYISYFEGADRVSDEFPNHFDLSIIVDTGGAQQLGRTLEKYQARITKKPVAIIDHHPNREPMPFPTHEVVDPEATSTAEVLVTIAKQLEWQINSNAANLMVPGILADTRNLSIATVSSKTFRTMADLIDLGADIYAIHEAYRASDRLSPELVELKGRLLSRMELYEDGKIAVVTVTPDELKQYAEMHDPADLVIYELQNAIGVAIAIVFRHYNGLSNKIKVSTRASMPVAAKACKAFGGGGHDRAAGCQFNDTPITEVKTKFIAEVAKQIKDYEALQHPH